MNKLTLPLKQRMPFASCPALAEIEEDRVLTNAVALPWESHARTMKLWVIGHVFGAVAAVWADCEQDALDEAADSELLECFSTEESEVEVSVREDDFDERCTRLGNHSLAFKLDDMWMGEADLDKLPREVLCRLAEARGACTRNLGEI